MERSKSIARFLSCRGVSFKRAHERPSPFAVLASSQYAQDGGPLWLWWAAFYGHSRGSSQVRWSVSRSSCHYCYLDTENEEDGNGEDGEMNGEEVSNDLKNQKNAENQPEVALFRRRIRKTPGALYYYQTKLVLFRKAALFSICNIFVLTLCRSEAII